MPTLLPTILLISCQPCRQLGFLPAGNRATQCTANSAAIRAANCTPKLLLNVLSTMLCLPAANRAVNLASYLLPSVLSNRAIHCTANSAAIQRLCYVCAANAVVVPTAPTCCQPCYQFAATVLLKYCYNLVTTEQLGCFELNASYLFAVTVSTCSGFSRNSWHNMVMVNFPQLATDYVCMPFCLLITRLLVPYNGMLD